MQPSLGAAGLCGKETTEKMSIVLPSNPVHILIMFLEKTTAKRTV